MNNSIIIKQSQKFFYIIYERRQQGEGGSCPPWIFIHGTDKVGKGLMVLFFGLFFSFIPLEFFLLTPLYNMQNSHSVECSVNLLSYNTVLNSTLFTAS